MTPQRLGDNQIALLLALRAHGFWHDGCGWVLGTRSVTLNVLRSLEARGLVVTAGRFRSAPFLWSLAPDVAGALDTWLETA